jgi:hypothetical protein
MNMRFLIAAILAVFIGATVSRFNVLVLIPISILAAAVVGISCWEEGYSALQIAGLVFIVIAIVQCGYLLGLVARWSFKGDDQ